MALSYNGLWKLLIDKGMKKLDLKELTKMSPSTLAKMGKNEPVSLSVLERICAALGCDIGDIVAYVPEPDDNAPR
ncbi:MAG: helix-turn-helix domain-containing protein [Oscillospiraceae bacterium]